MSEMLQAASISELSGKFRTATPAVHEKTPVLRRPGWNVPKLIAQSLVPGNIDQPSGAERNTR